MDSKYLVVNGGSSSLKFSLFDKDENEMVNGYVEKAFRIGIGRHVGCLESAGGIGHRRSCAPPAKGLENTGRAGGFGQAGQ